eukprot:403364211
MNLPQAELDFQLLFQIDPIINQQQQYIQQLESELSVALSQIQHYEKAFTSQKHFYDDQLAQLEQNYVKHKSQFEDQCFLINKERNQLQIDREDAQNLVKIYRETSETTETMNKRLLLQVKTQEQTLQSKENLIVEIRAENLKLSQDYFSLKQELENQIQITLDAQNHKLDISNQLEFCKQQIRELEQGLESKKSEVQLTKKEEDIDDLRQEKLSLNLQLREAKQDCEHMGEMLESTELRLNQLEERERLLREESERLRIQKQEFRIEQEKLRLMKEQNSKMQQELEQERLELRDSVQKRVGKILDQERKNFRQELSNRENELRDAQQMIDMYKHEKESETNQVQGLREEVKQLKGQIMQLSEKQISMNQEHIFEISRLKETYQHELDQMNSQVFEVNQQLKNLEYDNDDKMQKLDFLQIKVKDQQIEHERMREDYNRIKDKYNRLLREKENFEVQFKHKEQSLREKLEEMEDYSNDRLNKFSEMDQRKKLEIQESERKSYEVYLQQERMTMKWKNELESTVTAYEAMIAKQKKEIKALRKDVSMLKTPSFMPIISQKQGNHPKTFTIQELLTKLHETKQTQKQSGNIQKEQNQSQKQVMDELIKLLDNGEIIQVRDQLRVPFELDEDRDQSEQEAYSEEIKEDTRKRSKSGSSKNNNKSFKSKQNEQQQQKKVKLMREQKAFMADIADKAKSQLKQINKAKRIASKSQSSHISKK